MPSLYTHHTFGSLVKAALPPEAQVAVTAHPLLFELGLQGPDLLFYYKPLTKHPINQLGQALHRQPALAFMSHGRTLLYQADGTPSLPHIAYLYGFLCHFVLDSQCHPYIVQYEEDHHVSHSEIEVAVDRQLMVDHGKDPLRFLISDCYPTDQATATTLAPFYPALTSQDMSQSIASMVKYHRILRSPFLPKRLAIYGGLMMAGKYASMHGLVVPYRPNSNCHESTKVICKKMEEACPIACTLIQELTQMALPLSSMYQKNFG